MRGFIEFMSSQNGRYARMAIGAVLFLLGVFVLNTSSIVRILVMLIGAVVFGAGAFDYCLFAPLAGLPIKGADTRKALRK